MDIFEQREKEFGTVALKGRWPQDRVIIFLGAVEPPIPDPNGELMSEAKDHLVFTPYGPYAIRHYVNTTEGKNSLDGFNGFLYQQYDARYGPGGKEQQPGELRLVPFDPDKRQLASLEYNPPGTSRFYNFYQYSEPDKSSITPIGRPKILPGAAFVPLNSQKEIDDAIEASKKKVKNMNIPSADRAVRESFVISVVDSLIRKYGTS